MPETPGLMCQKHDDAAWTFRTFHVGEGGVSIRHQNMVPKRAALASCAEKMSEWTKLFLAVDSGAYESVIDAAELVAGDEVQETRSSRSGLVYASATGEEIPNLGDALLPMMTKQNTKRSIKMQVAEVSRPLAGVKRMCGASQVVVFDEDGSFILNKMTGEIPAQKSQATTCSMLVFFQKAPRQVFTGSDDRVRQ